MRIAFLIETCRKVSVNYKKERLIIEIKMEGAGERGKGFPKMWDLKHSIKTLLIMGQVVDRCILGRDPLLFVWFVGLIGSLGCICL